jgi:poly-D-alanine transfer protein DltD
LFTKTELLRTVEDQQRIYVRKLREDYQKLNDKNEHSLYCKDIEYEDLRSLTWRQHEESESRKYRVIYLDEEIRKHKEEIEGLKEDVTK